MTPVYGYLRVSSRGQERRGFGLRAQRSMLDSHCSYFKKKLLKVFVERASGLNNNRPIVNNVINRCKKEGVELVVPRQCRLSRNAWFVTGLIEEKFNYTNADSPYATDHDKRVQAVMDQREAERIKENTRNSLKAVVSKGKKLGGNPKKLKRTLRRKRSDYLKKNKVRFLKIAREHVTLRARTNVFNRLRITKLNGKRGGWHVSEVYGIYRDLKKIR